ncbi:MAG: hypothetical protein KIT25_10025 [Enhydrobacter sp.]|nr:MAG: hypothetical protein KIT25_10025 [Enhydrobacter sp.]
MSDRSLFDEDPFAQPRAERERRLLAELVSGIAAHRQAGPLFDRICEATGWPAATPPARLEDLPFIPAQYFKEAGEELVSVPKERRLRSLSSSATSGRASTVVLDQATARRQVRAVASTLAKFIGPQRRPMLVCDVPPEQARTGEISARAAAMLGFMTFASAYKHLLTLGPGSIVALDEGALEQAQAASQGKPVTIIGFTFLLYTALIEPLDRAGRRIPLPEGSTILHIGGWKKLEDRKVDRLQLAAAASRVFGIDPDRIVDCYGFTEQMGTLHLECSAGCKHAPAFADVIVRDPLTMAVLPDGDVGAGQFLSLVPLSYPGNSVLTDDLVRVIGRDTCPCGRQGTTFEVLGRHKSAEVRGCGDVLAEKIVLQMAPPVPAGVSMDRARATTKPQAVSYFGGGVAYRQFAGDRPLPSVKDWGALERRLRLAQRELTKLPVDDIVGVLDVACARWSAADSPFAAFHPHGLSFVAGLVAGGGFQRMVNASLRGSRGHVDGFRPAAHGAGRLRALPLGIVAHWLAGNVPTLGFLSLMLSLAAKNANVVKVPESVSPLLPEMLATIADVRYASPSGREVKGHVLTDCIEALWYPHDAADGALLSRMADARIVWGGAEAVRSIASLPRRHDCVDIVFGPKLSLAAVGREALANESLARRAARGVAIDCSVFDQEACASAHTVFVELGGEVTPSQFARLLAEQMAAANRRIPRLGVSGQVAGALKSARMQHFLNGEVLAPASLEWSVLYREVEERPAPVYGRCALVRPISDLGQIARHLDRDTQAVGLALPGARRLAVAEAIAQGGVDRITEPGQMAEFAAPWDGVFPLDRLVRWVSLSR